MEKTLLIYDMTGNIIISWKGHYTIPDGLPYIEVIVPNGKRVVSVNVETKEPVFEDIPLSEIEILQDKISILEQSQDGQDDKIINNMLATTELFEMVLSISGMQINMYENKNNKGGNNMVEVYATLIIEGHKTLEQVPTIIREQVRIRLVELGIPGYDK